MKKTNGFILITTLIFLLILSILAYQALESALMETKLRQTVDLQKKLFDQAQENLETAEEKEFRNYCPDPDRVRCINYEQLAGDNYKITSKRSQGDMLVKLELTCKAIEYKENNKTKIKCGKRLSWAQIE